ncbi:MAG: energy transducer TonB [Bacteroidia bacterium]
MKYLFLILLSLFSFEVFAQNADSTEVEEIDSFSIAVPAKFKEGNIDQYIAEHTKYPRKAMKKEIEGTVLVKFTVYDDGTVGHIEIVSVKLGGGLEEEAMRVIATTSGKWKPATQRGKPVNMRFMQPFKFQLE